jgi:hypothetical protein
VNPLGIVPVREVYSLFHEVTCIPEWNVFFRRTMELEYPVPADSDIVAEARKCLAYVKSCLA